MIVALKQRFCLRKSLFEISTNMNGIGWVIPEIGSEIGSEN